MKLSSTDSIEVNLACNGLFPFYPYGHTSMVTYENHVLKGHVKTLTSTKNELASIILH